jgi:hypothetical protein
MQEAVKLLLTDKVVVQRPILGPEFLRGGFGLVGEAFDVKGLVVRRALEGRQPRGDGVVGARLDLDVVRRIGVAEMDGGAADR